MVYFQFEPDERFQSTWSPIVDVYERRAAIIVRVELPGVEKNDIKLRWREGVLTIAGTKRRQPAEQGGCRYLCMERNYGYFRRDIAIGAEIDFAKSSAELRDGLLNIQLPKLMERDGETFIPIE